MKLQLECGQCGAQATVSGETDVEAHAAWVEWTAAHKPDCDPFLQDLLRAMLEPISDDESHGTI